MAKVNHVHGLFYTLNRVCYCAKCGQRIYSGRVIRETMLSENRDYLSSYIDSVIDSAHAAPAKLSQAEATKAFEGI